MGNWRSAFLCSSPLYEYKGVVFKYSEHGMIGPWPLRKDGSPKARAGKKFYDLFAEWDALPDKEKYRIGGGYSISPRLEGEWPS